MNEEQEREAEAELVKRCLAGEPAARETLAGKFMLAACICLAHCRRDHWDGREDHIEEAEHDVWCHLLATGAKELEGFDPKAGNLAPYLARLVWQRVRDLERSERRLHNRERAVAAGEVTEPRDDVDWEELVHGIAHLVTGKLRQALEAAARGQRSEGDPERTAARHRQIACRVRRLLATHGLGTPAGENGKNP